MKEIERPFVNMNVNIFFIYRHTWQLFEDKCLIFMYLHWNKFVSFHRYIFAGDSRLTQSLYFQTEPRLCNDMTDSYYLWVFHYKNRSSWIKYHYVMMRLMQKFSTTSIAKCEWNLSCVSDAYSVSFIVCTFPQKQNFIHPS